METTLTTPVTNPEVTAPPASAPPAVEAAPEWLKGVDPEIYSDPSMKAIQDLPSLAKSYVHAQRMVGKNRVVIPDQNADPQTKKEFFMKLGLPADIKDYQVAVKDGAFAPDFQEQFNKLAYDHNVLPDQAKNMLEYMNNAIVQHNAAMEQEAAQEVASNIENLKKEWGPGFEKNLHQAQQVVKLFGDDELKKHFDESGIGNDPKLIKFLTKIGASLKEDTFQREAVGHLGVSKQDAQRRIDDVMGDKASPYYNANHPMHKQVYAEMQKMFDIITQ